MADPIVHLTNGIPDSGTGNITTLGAVVTALGTPMQATGGSVTANAGTNLNTSALALESGGNLASAVTKLTSLVTGTVLAAGSAIVGAFKISDGTNTATVKAASTAVLATDTALVVAISPNSAGSVAQGSTTSGQTGALIQGAVTTAAPTYTTAQTSPLSLDTTGALRVNVTAGGAGGGAVTNAGTFAVQATLAAETTKVIGTVNVSAAQTIAVTNAGTFAVQAAAVLGAETTKVIGTVNVSAAQSIALAPATSGGLTETGIVTTAAAVVGFVKASAGQLYKVEVSNNSAAWVYLKLYNATSAPTAGAGTPQRRIGVPPSSTLLSTADIGGVYSTGIAYAITGAAADADTTAIAANILVNFHWK